MNSSLPLIIYIHGFNSSPASAKAQQFIAACQHRADLSLEVPELPHDPREAVELLESRVNEAGDRMHLLVGSSLGGYYATHLAEKAGCKAALVNPAVSPVKTLGDGFIGIQKNLYTGEEYEFTRDYARFLDTLDVEVPMTPEKYLVLLQSGDAVLDYRLAVERYAGATQVVQQGGSHRFENFARVIPAILAFADDGELSADVLEDIRQFLPEPEQH